MSQNAVLDSGDLTPQPSDITHSSVTSGVRVDPVETLHHAFFRPESSVAHPGADRHRRPFDAQYWACWLVTVTFPVLVAYLLITR